MTLILIFGDSITHGGDKKGGWVNRLREILYEKELSNNQSYYPIYNLGVDGDTTEWLLERLEQETKSRLNEEEVLFIFQIGANDSQIFYKTKKPIITEEAFSKNIQKIISKCREIIPESKIVFLGVTPIDQNMLNPIPWAHERAYNEERRQKLSKIIKKKCEENKIYFIELNEKLSKLGYQKMLRDGVHPTIEGHKEIFGIVKEFMASKKII